MRRVSSSVWQSVPPLSAAPLIYARAAARTVAAAVEFIVTSFNGQKAVSRIPVHWNLYGSLTNGM